MRVELITISLDLMRGSPILIGAIVTVHGAKGWVFTAAGGGWEYPAYLFVLCLAQAMLGDGKLALSPSLQFGPRSNHSKADIR